MFPIKEAAVRAGLTPETLRAWERRYHVVNPQRTEGGYRLYTEAEIERLREIRSLVEAGWKPREAAEHVLKASRGKAAEPAETAAPHRRAMREAAGGTMVAPFVEAAAAFDAARLALVLDDIGASASFEEACEQHLFPCLRALGEAWAAGGLSVASEHFASAAVHRWLGRRFEASARERAPAQVVVGLPPAARHELGALAFSIGLRRLGVPTIYLGADVPVAAWVEATAPACLRLAVIGTVRPEDEATAVLVTKAVRAARPDLRIAFGGANATGLAPFGTVLPRSLPQGVSAAAELASKDHSAASTGR